MQTSAHKIVAGIFWDIDGIFLVEFLNRHATINSVICAVIKEVKTMNSNV
jgi:hypothetical protein